MGKGIYLCVGGECDGARVSLPMEVVSSSSVTIITKTEGDEILNLAKDDLNVAVPTLMGVYRPIKFSVNSEISIVVLFHTSIRDRYVEHLVNGYKRK